MPSFREHFRQGRKDSLLFQHPEEGTLPNFADVLDIAMQARIVTKSDGNISLAMPHFEHRDGGAE